MSRLTPLAAAIIFSLALGCSAPQGGPPGDSPEETTSGDPAVTSTGQPVKGEMLELLTCWFDTVDSWVFIKYESPTLMVKVGGKSFGEYQVGPLAAITYGLIHECMPPQGASSKTDIYSYMATLSGEEIILPTKGSVATKEPFDHYNPAFIAWAVDHLVPLPSQVVGGAKAQAIYSVVFAGYFRMLAETHAWLQKSGNVQQKIDDYLGQVSVGTYAPIDHLWSNYHKVLPQYQGYSFNGGMAIGFWLRRTADGSADEIWRGVKKVVRGYDKQWYPTLKKKYGGAGIVW